MTGRSRSAARRLAGAQAGHSGWRRGSSGEGVDAGAVTAELAIGLTSITIALGAVLSTVSLGAAQLSVTGAAHAVARATARGEAPAQAQLRGTRLAGDQAQVGIARGRELTEVTVQRRLPLLLPGRPVVTIRGSATALTEEPS